MFHCVTSDTDPTGLRRLLRTQGKLVNFIGRKPLICWGRKNPISHLSRIKNPGLLLFVHSSDPAGLPLYTASLDVRTPWEPLLPSSSLSKAKVRALARPCRLIDCRMPVVSYILTTPCVLSLILTIAIYGMPPPPRAIEGVGG